MLTDFDSNSTIDQAGIYLDYAAATPVDRRVLAAMLPYFTDNFYNPSSSYLAAHAVRSAIESARARVGHWLGARSVEIIFTAGATESINLAIHGVMRQHADGQILVCAIEHPAVLEAAKNYNHKIIDVLPDGILDLESLRSAITDQTVLVSVGYANNELGVIQSMKSISALLETVRQQRRIAGSAKPLYFHTDASQAANYLDLHVSSLGVDLMSLNGAKIYGPKQSGILYVKAGIELAPVVVGGGQEAGLRSGTENVPAIIGLALALDLVQENRKVATRVAEALRDNLQRTLLRDFPDLQINGNQKKRLPNSLHLTWPGIDGERLIMLLDEAGVMAATGSACAANKHTQSSVLLALGFSDAQIQGSLRLSLGDSTTQDQIEQSATIITRCVRKLLV